MIEPAAAQDHVAIAMAEFLKIGIPRFHDEILSPGNTMATSHFEHRGDSAGHFSQTRFPVGKCGNIRFIDHSDRRGDRPERPLGNVHRKGGIALPCPL